MNEKFAENEYLSCSFKSLGREEAQAAQSKLFSYSRNQNEKLGRQGAPVGTYNPKYECLAYQSSPMTFSKVQAKIMPIGKHGKQYDHLTTLLANQKDSLNKST